MSWNSFWEGVGDAASDFGEAFVDNAKDAIDNTGTMFEEAGDAFSSGNITGGIYRGALGVLDTIGNVGTLGGANALGTLIEEDSESDTPLAVTKAVDYVARNEAESLLIEDDLSNGQYVEYEYNEDTNTLEVAKDADGNAIIYTAETDEDKEKFKSIANAMGGVDVASLAVDFASAGFGSGASKIGSTVAKTAAKEGAEEVAEQTVKTVAKTVAKEGAEEIAEQTAKTVAKEGVEEIAEETVEKTAKTAAKDTAKHVGLSSIKQSLNDMPLLEKAGISAGVSWINHVGTNSQRVAENEIYGTDYAIASGVSSVIGSTTDVATTAVKDVGGVVANGFLSKFPGLGKFVNTCRAGAYATAKSVAHTEIGAGAVALVVKPFDYIKSKLKDRQGEYFEQSISEVADTLQEESLADGRTWTDLYVDKVTELDESIGVDSSTRGLVANYIDDASEDNSDYSLS